jgi:hypothetical protein
VADIGKLLTDRGERYGLTKPRRDRIRQMVDPTIAITRPSVTTARSRSFFRVAACWSTA